MRAVKVKLVWIFKKAEKRAMAKAERKSVMFSVAEVAAILNVHENTVRRWSNDGRIKSYRIGRRRDRGFTAEDLKDFIESDLVNPLDFYRNSVAEDGGTTLTLLSIS